MALTEVRTEHRSSAIAPSGFQYNRDWEVAGKGMCSFTPAAVAAFDALSPSDRGSFWTHVHCGDFYSASLLLDMYA